MGSLLRRQFTRDRHQQLHQHFQMVLQATVKGLVQGVGFRMFVLDAGRRLGLRGYVRNAEDGSVQVLAAGDEARLKELLTLLHRGPSAAHVTGVTESWSEHEPDWLGPWFEVRP